MKHLAIIISFVLFSGAIQVQAQYKPVEVVMKDGSKREGLAKVPYFADKNVHFKTSESDKTQNIKSKEIQTLIFDGGETEMEYHNCKLNETIAIVTEWGWLTVVWRGPVTTYTGGLPSPSGSVYSGDYNNPYCHRDGEKYAIVIPSVGFAAKMAKYFEDYPELSAKIKDKQTGYRPVDIDEIIEEYNKWKMAE